MSVTKTSWKPGQSGNPAGRPKGRRALSEAMNALLAEPVDVTSDGEPIHRAQRLAAALVELAESADDPTVKLRALSLILDRVEGRPAAADAITPGDFRRAVGMVLDEWITAIADHVPDERVLDEIYTDMMTRVENALHKLGVEAYG